jgi:hypothetical protein
MLIERRRYCQYSLLHSCSYLVAPRAIVASHKKHCHTAMLALPVLHVRDPCAVNLI